jgi:hypothetical protein
MVGASATTGARPLSAPPQSAAGHSPPAHSKHAGRLLATLQDPRDTYFDQFGYATAISGSIAVVGAPGGTGYGETYIFERGASGWSTTPAVTLDNPNDVPYFGSAVAVSGSIIVVGAYGISGDGQAPPGAAYIYVKGADGWPTSPTASLADPGADNKDGFGWSVAVSGRNVAVGAPREDGGAGGTYLYSQTGGRWPTTPTAVFTDPTASDVTDYGRAVALDGTTLVVGADGTPGTAGPTASPGSAFLYIAGKAGWPSDPTVTLTDPLATDNDGFGSGVALSGDSLVVGAGGAPNPDYPGAAYQYEKTATGWPTTPTAVLGRANAEDDPQHYFGYAVADSASMAVVGAPGAYEGPTALYVYAKKSENWPYQPTFQPGDPNPAGYDGYGETLGMSGDTVIAGAWEADTEHGAAYIYRF